MMNIVMACLWAIPGVAVSEDKPASVCDILGHLESYSGRIVRVRANVQGGLGVWLADEECPVVIRAGSVEFRNIIALSFTDSADVIHSRPKITVPFKSDEESGRLIEKALAARDLKTQHLYAVVEGMIVTRDPPLALVARNDPTNKIGFGHLGMAPAMIVVKRISGIEIRPKQ